MKKLIIILALAVLTLIAQEPDPYSFFPSSVGNVWEWSNGLRVEFIRDSIGQNLSKYLWVPGYSPPLYKIDTNYNVFWDPVGGEVGPPGNFLTYKLNADSGDLWIVDTYVQEEQDTFYMLALVRDKYPYIIFGSSTTIMEIAYFDYQQDTTINEYSLEWLVDYLGYGFGLIQEWEVEGGPTMVLIGCIIDGDTIGTITNVNEYPENIPEKIILYQNYPNPFNPETKIIYSLNRASKVKLIIYDILGREIETLVNDFKSAGAYSVTFNAGNLPSGVYIYTLITESDRQSKKMILKK